MELSVINATESSLLNKEVFQEQNGWSCFSPNLPRVPQEIYFSFTQIFILPVTILLSVWCVVSNLIVIIAVLRSGIQQIRPGLLIICSLTLTDFLWGGLALPPHIIFWIQEIMKSKVCANFDELRNTLYAIPFLACFISTIGNLAVMSVDRYLAVAKAMQYKFLMNRKRAIFACSFVWLFAVLFGILKKVNVLGDLLHNGATSAFVVTTTVVISVAQVLTLRILRRHNNAVADLTAETNQVNPRAIAANSATERQLTVTTSYVVVFLILILAPLSCFLIANKVANLLVIPLVDPVVTLIATIVSSINPVVYYRANTQIRSKISSLLKCC